MRGLKIFSLIFLGIATAFVGFAYFTANSLLADKRKNQTAGARAKRWQPKPELEPELELELEPELELELEPELEEPRFLRAQKEVLKEVGL